MEQEFSVGEWVERVTDRAVGKVKTVLPYEYDGGDPDFVFAVDLDPHRPAREDIWSGITGAWRRHFRWHAHVSTSSRDCDGDYTGGHVVEMTVQERCDQFGDLHFKERVLGDTVTLHGSGTLSVTPDGLEWYEDTDEGYRRADVRWCEDDCPTERSWQRDHRAEAAGY